MSINQTVIISFIFLLVFPANARAYEAVGSATKITGDVKIQHHSKNSTQALHVGDSVYLGDKILTSEGGYVHITFVDKTSIALNGEDGILTIDEYVFDPANLDKSRAKFSIFRASFEFIGGLIDSREDPQVQIDLDFGSIGIRGTKVLRAMKNDECWIFLEEGRINVFNEGGAVELNPGDGTRMSDSNKAPREVEPWSKKDINWIRRVTKLPE